MPLRLVGKMSVYTISDAMYNMTVYDASYVTQWRLRWHYGWSQSGAGIYVDLEKGVEFRKGDRYSRF